jgi:formylglycine-generating enzyme required for sulfatase activity/tRNA A-37 threonylcarbamoyl transferase component Bud32
MIGKIIKDYRVKRLTGEGGMAMVYEVEHQLLHVRQALKVLKIDLVRNENIRKRFLAEARSMARMSHPNIVKVIDLIDDGDDVAFIMEYIEGETLKDYLHRKGKLNDDEILSLFPQMLKAVDYVHSQNLVHRDIKPSNFMLDRAGNIKLMDFGIAKNTDTANPEYTQTGTSMQMGTPMYMSPEQITETKNVTAQSDIYSLGVVLWQMVMGRRPFESDLSDFALKKKIVEGRLETTDSAWEFAICKATEKDLDVRFDSCAAFERELSTKYESKEQISGTSIGEVESGERTVIEQKGTSVSEKGSAVAATEVDSKPPKSNRAPWIALALAAIGVVVMTVFAQWSNYTNPPSPNAAHSINAPAALAHEIELVRVEGGTFQMGGASGGEDNERPVHAVTLSSFYIGKYEVTQAQWREVMGSNPSYFTNCDQCPVEQVSWNDVKDYIQKLNAKTGKQYRLPTEAEWEFAARGGNQSKGYTYSGSNDLQAVAWFRENTKSKTYIVGQRQANELGIHDMSGNVWEWCSDWYGDYKGQSRTNPTGPPSGDFRVLRGGCWSNFAQNCRSADRGRGSPGNRDRSSGFRLVLSLSSPGQ